MDVATAPIEAEATSEPMIQASADEPNAAVEQPIHPGNAVPREHFRAVFLNTPLPRLAKMLLCATLCATLLNPPSSVVSWLQTQSVSGFHDSATDLEANDAARVEASEDNANRNIVRKESARKQLAPTTVAAAAVETAGVQGPLPVLQEAASPVTTSPAVVAAVVVEAAGSADLHPFLRETASLETAASTLTAEEEVVHKQEIPKTLFRGVKGGVSTVLGKDDHTELIQDSESRPTAPEEVKPPEVSEKLEQPKVSLISLGLSLLDATWHIVIAATVLIGFMFELRRSGADLLRSLPEYLASKVPLIARQ